jgi:hypothetical protein
MATDENRCNRVSRAGEAMTPAIANLMRRAEEALGRFCSDEGWTQDDIETLDAITAALAIRGCGQPSAAAVQPSEPLCDCGTNEGFAFEHAKDCAAVQPDDAADALRYRWLMQHHGEAIRKAIAPNNPPGDVITFQQSEFPEFKQGGAESVIFDGTDELVVMPPDPKSGGAA